MPEMEAFPINSTNSLDLPTINEVKSVYRNDAKGLTPEGLKNYLSPSQFLRYQKSKNIIEALEKQYRQLCQIGKIKEASYLHKYSHIMENCRRSFIQYKTRPQDSKKHKYYFCKKKLCPICNESERYYLSNLLIAMLNAVGGEYYGVYTYSPKNPTNQELEKFLSSMKHSVSEIYKSGAFPYNNYIHGMIYKIETTYSYHTGFHPHLHLLLCFKEKTFNRNNIDNIFKKLNKHFGIYIGISSSVPASSVLKIYPVTFSNIKQTADYFAKCRDHNNIADSLSTMDIETLLIYMKAFCNLEGDKSLREKDSSGIYRKTLSHYKKLNKAKLIEYIKGLQGYTETPMAAVTIYENEYQYPGIEKHPYDFIFEVQDERLKLH